MDGYIVCRSSASVQCLPSVWTLLCLFHRTLLRVKPSLQEKNRLCISLQSGTGLSSSPPKIRPSLTTQCMWVKELPVFRMGKWKPLDEQRYRNTNEMDLSFVGFFCFNFRQTGYPAFIQTTSGFPSFPPLFNRKPSAPRCEEPPHHCVMDWEAAMSRCTGGARWSRSWSQTSPRWRTTAPWSASLGTGSRGPLISRACCCPCSCLHT